jgi:peptidoglycan/xylan/chitin deacetylase (PgdA/CDA1 family)
MVGEQVEAYSGTARRIVADGHRLCNHSMRHDDLADLSADRIKDDIAGTDAAIARAAPGATVTYFRAPYGDWGRSAKVGAQLGHTPLGWVVDPDDWMMPGAGVIASRIEQQLTPRAVVLVHDGGGNREQTIAALKKAIPKLLDEGWTFDFPATTVRAHPLASSGPASPATTVPATPAEAGTVSPEAPVDSGEPAGPGKTPDPVLSGSTPP